MATITKAEYEEHIRIIQRTFEEASVSGVQDILILEGEHPVLMVKGVVSKDKTLRAWTRKTFNVLMCIILHKKMDEYTDTLVLDFLKAKVEKNFANLDDGIGHVKQGVFGSHDFKLNFGQSTFRCHLHTGISKSKENTGGVQLVINVRTHPNVIPKLETLNLPPIDPIFMSSKGLLLVSGSANAGKSTTVVSIIDRFNHMTDKQRIIVTAEDPVEYIIPNVNAFIIQKQIGGVNGNAENYQKASDDAMRENADIVFIGEIRTSDEILNALRLADLGKLVIATIHAVSVPDTIERIVGEFSGDTALQIRTRLTNNLLGIIHQELFVKNGEQYPLVSMLIVTSDDVRNALAKCQNRQELDNFMLTGNAHSNDVMEQNPYSHVYHPLDGFNYLKERGILTDNDEHRFFRSSGEDKVY